MFFFIFFQEDLVICEYCDQGVHYSCLSPPPEKRPKVWDCDDCLIARGKPPNNNVSKKVLSTPGPRIMQIHLVRNSRSAILEKKLQYSLT